MEIFVAVADTGQFTRAGKALGISISAVSHAISDLESHLGAQLISRTNRNLSLTEAGINYLGQCQNILSQMRQLEDSFKSGEKELEGRVSMTAPISYGINILSPILSEFMDRHPKLDLNLSLSDRTLNLVEDGMDVAIRIGVMKDSALISKRLSSITLNLCASPDFIRNNPQIKSPKDLNNQPCLRYVKTPKWPLSKDGKKVVVTPTGPILTNSGEALRAFASLGRGIVYLPDFIANEALADGRLARLLPDFQGETLGVYAVYLPNRHKPHRIQKLLEYLTERLC